MPDDLTESEALALLADRRRRMLLRSLRDSSTPLPMTELATRIRAAEHDDLSPGELKSIRVSLHHVHLPRLEEAAVVEYDENERTVRHDRNFETLVDWLENVTKGDPSSHDP